MKLITSSNSWEEFESKLEKLSKKEKGDAFEELVRLFLLTDPVYTGLLKNVWHHSKIPQEIIDELELPETEIGTDLICKTKKDEYWIIQCKFHQDSNVNLSLGELSTFFSETDNKIETKKISYRLVASSASGISIKIKNRKSKKLGFMLHDIWSELGTSEFNIFREFIKGEKPTYKPFEPRKHQKYAINKCKKYFQNKKNTKGKLIHPCATGKSLTSYWFAEALNAKSILIAVPSIALVRQTLNVWARESYANKIDMDWIAVCSDDSVSNIDEFQMTNDELDIEVTTDPGVISKFFKKSNSKLKVIITTYQSGKVLEKGIKKMGIVFDLGIFDEAHKTVGHKDKLFSHLLDDKNIQINRRIFMTATEKFYRGKSEDILSMDHKNLYGDLIDQMSFKKALNQKPQILSDYKIVTSIVLKSEIDELIKKNKVIKPNGKNWDYEADASTFASMIMLQKLIGTTEIRHAVSFHRSIQRARDFERLFQNIEILGKNKDNLKVFHVNGKDGAGKRSLILKKFVNSNLGLITNARCLTEGVDIPSIDIVLFADPKQSKVDIVQAAGRVMRKCKGKKQGYILVPVVTDLNKKDYVDRAYDQIIDVISALGMHDSRIIDEFKDYATGVRKKGGIVEFDIPSIIPVDYKDLEKNIKIKVWDRIDNSWHHVIQKIKKFKRKEGHVRIPHKYKSDGFNLGMWVYDRRKEIRWGTSRLSKEKLRELFSLGISKEIRLTYDNYEEKFKKLKQFIKREGFANIRSLTIEDGIKIGLFVAYTRQKYRDGKLAKKELEEFNSIPGWHWGQYRRDARIGRKVMPFEHAIDTLKNFQKEHGHLPISRKLIINNFMPSIWMKERRKAYKNGKLSKDKIKKIESIPGWEWKRKTGRPKS